MQQETRDSQGQSPGHGKREGGGNWQGHSQPVPALLGAAQGMSTRLPSCLSPEPADGQTQASGESKVGGAEGDLLTEQDEKGRDI